MTDVMAHELVVGCLVRLALIAEGETAAEVLSVLEHERGRARVRERLGRGAVGSMEDAVTKVGFCLCFDDGGKEGRRGALGEKGSLREGRVFVVVVFTGRRSVAFVCFCCGRNSEIRRQRWFPQRGKGHGGGAEGVLYLDSFNSRHERSTFMFFSGTRRRRRRYWRQGWAGGGLLDMHGVLCFFFSFIHGEKVGFRDFPSPDLASAMLIFVPTVVHAPSHSTHLDLPRSLFGRATKTFCLRLYNTIVSLLRLLGFLFVCPIQEFRRRNVHGAFVKWVKPIVPVLVTNVPTLFYTNYQHEDLIVD